MKAILIAVLLFAPVAAVTPGLMRREPEGVLIEQDAQASRCDSVSDANCCFTQAGVDMAAAVGRTGIAVGQCAAGAKGIAGDKWKNLLKQGLEVCTNDACKGASDVPVEGTCSAFTCPKGFTRRTDFRPAAPCTDATVCRFNCCDLDFSETGDRQGSTLSFAILQALQNVTRFGNQMNFPEKHDPADRAADIATLEDNVGGLYNVMGKILTLAAKKEVCPAGDYTSIRGCLHKAICIMERNIDTGITSVDVETYSLLQEYYTRFETITWEAVTMDLGGGDGGYSKEELVCVGLTRFLKAIGGGSSLIQKVNIESAVYRVSSVLLDASKTTHALLDAHKANSSLSATFQALHRAWEPPCKLLNCDHTNYWDLLGASHAHSLALFESGASAQHMTEHIKARQRLEFRMQQFFGDHAAQGAEVLNKIYRVEGTVGEARMSRYGAVVTDSLQHVMTNHPKTYGFDFTMVSLVNQKAAGKFFKTPLQKRLLKAFHQQNLLLVADEQAMAQLAQSGVFADDEELDSEEERDLETLIHRTLIFKAIGGFFQDVGKAVVSVGKAAVKGVKEVGKELGKVAKKAWEETKKAASVVAKGAAKIGQTIGKGIVKGFTALGEAIITIAREIGEAIVAFVDFIISLLECMGFGYCTATGYGKKFPMECHPPPCGNIGVKGSPCKKPTGVYTLGVSLSISIAHAMDLLYLYKGDILATIGVYISVVIGFVPDVCGGGIRIGVGIGVGFVCDPLRDKHKCYVELSVGLVASAAVSRKTPHPRCVLGPKPLGGLIGGCADSWGLVFKIVCCKFEIMAGWETCAGDGEEGSSNSPEQKKKIDDLVADGVPDGCDESYSSGDKGKNYRGCQTDTNGHRICQKWTSQYPHKHGKQAERYPDSGLGDHNMCRNMDGHSTIWCYTLDPGKRWENCEPKTGVELVEVDGSNPRGDNCQADCDTDAECQGQLKCFQRDGHEPVPGCRGGGAGDKSAWDYCYYSNGLDADGVDGYRRRMKNCQGDCDNNGDCASGYCFQREEGLVPGCRWGGDSDLKDFDYCYTGGWLTAPGDGLTGLQTCQGDCDTDGDCFGTLKCAQRNGKEDVQGCPGGGKEDHSGWDYCYSPIAVDDQAGGNGYRRRMKNCFGDCDNDNDCASGKCQQRDHSAELIPGCEDIGSVETGSNDICTGEFLVSEGGDGSRRRMKACVGDCDTDGDCAGDMKCFQRDAFTRVPGCGYGGSGDLHGYDYCVR